MNVVISFPRRPRLEALWGGRNDGFFVCYFDEHGTARQAVGGFATLNETRAWASDNADGVAIDWPSFTRLEGLE